MAKNKFYAIRSGVHPETKERVENLILTSWAEAGTYVTGVKAEYKGFPTLPEAEEYLGSSDPLLNKSEGKYNKHALHVYVDGSYNKDIPNYGYGMVCAKDGKFLHMQHGEGKNADAISMQQIGGELLGCMNGLLYALKNGHKEVVIFHDYKGVCYHAIGYWKRDNAFSETYYNWVQNFLSKNPSITVTFCKVDAHTGDDFNELADGQAKKSVGLEPNPIYFRTVQKLGIADC